MLSDRDEYIDMLNDTSKLAGKQKAEQFGEAVIAAQNSNALAESVEFWKWMARNYKKSGIFDSVESMQQYIAQGLGKEEWLLKQLQGKGYEWDWMKTQRGKIKNIFKTYDAGDIVNRAASDITEKNLLTGTSKEYQMKAYTSKTNPNLANTPKDMTVVTNAEKADIVRKNGYKNVEAFQDNETIKANTNKRMQEIKNGTASTSYNFKNVAGTMLVSGVAACVIGIGTEAISAYRLWKNGELSDKEYLKRIMQSGGDAGVTAGVTSGIMIPVSATVTALGASTLLTIPIAFCVTGAVNKIVAPCFGRGDYQKTLNNMKYYQNLEDSYEDLIGSMQETLEECRDFAMEIYNQNCIYQANKTQSQAIDASLKRLYDSI